jgi:hypothetical protein
MYRHSSVTPVTILLHFYGAMRYNIDMKKTMILKIQSNLFALFSPNSNEEGILYTENEIYQWLENNAEHSDVDLSEISYGERILVENLNSMNLQN